MIASATHVGAVHLTIRELSRSVRFYQEHLGFQVHGTDRGRARLGAGGDDLVVLDESPSAPRVRGTTGLYHFAILVPSRADLSRALRLLIETHTPLQGAADHGVSEALYLADPDGNGIEIYCDRPRSDWPFVDGRLQMTTDPLDLHALLNAPATQHTAPAHPAPAHPAPAHPAPAHPAPAHPAPEHPAPEHPAPEHPAPAPSTQHLAPSTRIGHVHLHISHLDAARHFYVDLLGLELMQRYGASALFVSAGGYHHHIGLNTWIGVGAPPPPAGAIGLAHFELVLPDAAALADITSRITAANIAVETIGESALVRDPSANAILLAIPNPQSPIPNP